MLGKQLLVYTIPEEFQESTSEYLDYRKKIGISDKTNQFSLLYIERFFDFLDGKEIYSPIKKIGVVSGGKGE